jgi:hypothetical protein
MSKGVNDRYFYTRLLHSDELRSPEFPRIPSASRPEYFTLRLRKSLIFLRLRLQNTSRSIQYVPGTTSYNRPDNSGIHPTKHICPNQWSVEQTHTLPNI